MRVERIAVGAFTIPTDGPESDGTLTWDSTTLVVVEASTDGVRGVGYTYAHAAAADVVERTLAGVVRGMDPLSPPAAWHAMRDAVRNIGRVGLVAHAISAVDCALWDLQARLLGVPLAALLGQVHDGVPCYGSGGFTSASIEELRRQLGGWASAGLPMVKMKVGRSPKDDPQRIAEARDAIGPDVRLFVDANGAFTRSEAIAAAERFARWDVAWFEEPVSSDDLEGLRSIRERAPAGMAIAAGEYGYDVVEPRRMLDAQAVDVLQADITRIQGISGLQRVAAMCEAWCVPLSAHTAPALHCHPCSALKPVVHVEYFHDHVRIEEMLFEGVQKPDDRGILRPGTAPGNGLTFRWDLARPYAS